MSNIEGLKEQARRHEQKEEWRKALDLYTRAIERLAENDTPDIGLHNRVGDLYIRVGEVDGAVEAFERAVDLYVEAELPNNAIAVCKKILRNVPDRAEVFLRMGQIRAEQGFVVDARSHYIAYAERKQAAGDVDEALRALMEFADVARDDTAIRLAIAEHLEQHDRADEAVDQLVEGYRSALRQELDDEAAAFRARLEELRPGFDLDEPAPAFPESGFAQSDAHDEADAFTLEPTSLAEDDDEVPADPHPEPFAIDSTAIVADDATGIDGDDPGDDEGEEWGRGPEAAFAEAMEDHAGEPAGAEGVDGSLEAAPDDEPEEAWYFGAVPPLGDASAPSDSEADAGVAADDDDGVTVDDEDGVTVAEEAAEPRGGWEPREFDVFADDPDEEEEPADDLEIPLSFFDDALSAIGPDVSAFPARTDDFNPLEGVDVVGDEDAIDDGDDDVEGPTELPFLHLPEGEPVVHRHDATHAEPFTDGDVVLSDLIAESPDDLDLRQRAVELAHRSGDEASLAEAYVGLGGALRRSGAEARARAVFRQALQLDPDHPEAKAALAAADEVAPPVAEVASNEDYVDLGALIFGDDDEKSTRFVVAYEEPSGDEQADFARMLNQFKAKVAQNVDTDDVKAHHDLGTAYKEMGLLDEAIEEFQAALRASAGHLPTYEMLGQAFLERGTPRAAVRVLNRALDVPFEVEDELLGIYYTLGRSHEVLGNTDEAREFYERVFSLDINFADVTERLRALR